MTTALSSGTFEQYTLLDQLSDTAKAQTKPSDNAMIIDEPAKPVAGSSKHPDNMDVINDEHGCQSQHVSNFNSASVKQGAQIGIE